jgi:uncharacterized membrane protein YciS (DUF1049 family)
MKKNLQDAWQGAVATLKAFGFVVLSMIIAELYFQVRPGPWTDLLFLGGSLAAAGFWRGWRGASLLGTVFGNVVAIVVVLVALTLLPDPIVKITPGELLARFLYVPVCSAVLAALGFLVARLIRGPQRQDSVPQLPKEG